MGTQVQAPNGDIYDLDETVASGLVGSANSGWSFVEGEKTTQPNPADAGGTDDAARKAAKKAAKKAVKSATPQTAKVTAAKSETVPETETAADPAGTEQAATGERSRPAGNASTAVWAEFATPLGIDVAGLSRDDIKAAVEAHEAAKSGS